MTKTKFKSIWGDLDVNNVEPVEEKPNDDAAKKAADEAAKAAAAAAAEEEEEEEEEETEAGDPPPEGGGDEGAEGDPPAGDPPANEEAEVDFSEEDIEKAYTMLIDEGVLELNEEDEFETSPQGLGDAVAATVRNKLQAEIAAIPPVVQSFYAHVMEGNDPEQFEIPKTVIWSEVNSTEEDNQKEAVLQFYRNQNMSEEDAQEELADAIAAGKLEKKATTAFNSLIAAQEKQITAKAESDAKAIKDAEKARAKEIKEIEETIDNADEYAGFKLDDKRKKAFKEYLFKVKPRTGKTQMQENMGSDDRRLTLAFLDFVNYNQEDLEKAVTTKLTKTRKKKLSRYSDKNVSDKNASASVQTKKKENTGRIKFPTIFGSQTIEVED